MRRTRMEVTAPVEPEAQDAPVPPEPWGLEPYDRHTGGLHARRFNLLECPDPEAGAAALGHFLAQGLERGRRAALVARGVPAVLERMARFGFEFDSAHASGQLVCLEHNLALTRAASLSSDYRNLAREITTAAGYVRRIAFAHAESLFHLHSEPAAHISAAKLAAAAAATGSTLFGIIAVPGGPYGERLRQAARSLLPGGLRLERQGPGRYRLGPQEGEEERLELELREGSRYFAV